MGDMVINRQIHRDSTFGLFFDLDGRYSFKTFFDFHALILDVDGTIIDIAATPTTVSVPGELVANLATLSGRFGGALAFVSGRSLTDLDRLFAPLRLPAAGQHGAEIRRTAAGAVEAGARSEALVAVTRALRAWAGGNPGILVEDKGQSVCIHYRLAPHLGAEARAAVDRALADAAAIGLEVIPARHAWDVRAQGVDKGRAIAALLSARAFQGRRPIFLGDDHTDEDGFRAVNRIGGLSVRVAPRGPTAAQHQIAGPADVRRWLSSLAGAQMVAP